MDEPRRIRILERAVSLEEEEVALRVILPDWRESLTRAIALVVLVGFVFSFVVLIVFVDGFAHTWQRFDRSERVITVSLGVVAALAQLGFLIISIRGVMKRKPRLSAEGKSGGSVYTVTLPLLRHWRGVKEDSELWRFFACDGGLFLSVMVSDMKLHSVTPPIANSGDEVELDFVVSQHYGNMNGTVLVAVRLLGDGVDAEIVDELRPPIASYRLSLHRRRGNKGKKSSDRIEVLVAHDLLYDLVHSVRAEELKPQLESRIRDEISLIDPLRV
ncbi:MAG: hypothetical protein AAFR96_12660 [Planctomycetota bacterium]